MKKKFNWLKMFNVTFSDTETTGLNLDYYYQIIEGKRKLALLKNGQEARIIELAGMTFGEDGYEGFYSDINRTDILVGPIAAATHGYTNKMLKNAPEFEETESYRRLKEDSNNGKYIVFHNAPFDEKMLNIHGFELNDKVIDTLRVCKHLYANGLIGLEDTEYYSIFAGELPENNQLQYFRYLMEMDDQPYFKEAMKMANLTEIKPHTALSDVFILWIFTAKLMKDFDITLEDMVRLTHEPIMEKEFKFGKHKGKTYQEIVNGKTKNDWGKWNNDYEYFDWIVKNMSISADIEYSMNYAMGKGILAGVVPFANIKGKDFKPFLYNAIRTSFNADEIRQGLEILGKPESFYQELLDNVERKTIKVLAEEEIVIDEDKKSKHLSVRENREFFLNYVNKYRRNILWNMPSWHNTQP